MKGLTLRICFLVNLFCGIPLFAQKQDQPNIILVMTDDQGWFDVGFNGNHTIKTPHLDAMARAGIILDRFYSASAVCSPTRASVLTGRNPLRIEIPTANVGHMKEEEITLAELLEQNGYATGHFGKWHLGIHTKLQKDANRGGREKFFKDYSIPSMHGYDEYFCTESKVPTFDPMVKPVILEREESSRYGWTAISSNDEKKAYGTAYWEGNEKKTEGNLSGDDTRVIMDRVIPFINRSVAEKTPFFTTIWIHTPHLPVVTSEKYKRKYSGLTLKQQLYYGSITAMDDQIGRLWETLKSLGVADNTMLWFCSDNGPENKTPGSSGYFRGRKRSLHEGGLRTPAFVIWADKLKGGIRSSFPAFTSDYLPTVLSVLNIEYPDSRPLDGMNILPSIIEQNAIRNKPMGFIFKNQVSWVNHNFKLISKDDGVTFELYDLIMDEKEERNIIATKTELARKMKLELKTWLKSVEQSVKGFDY